MTRRARNESVPVGDARTSFFRSRLRAPAIPPHYVRRPRLLELLDESSISPITSVVAPAGSGKTSLLVDWLSSLSIPAAWLSLDETDRDRGQLWTAVGMALSELVEGLDVRAGARRSTSTAPGVESALVAALDGDHPDAAVLVVDDVHLVDQDEEIAASLAQFLSSLPDWLHVVLASRHTPKLPVDRLRARGYLAEVHFSELQFSSEEAQEVLARLVPWLAEPEVNEVAERARGWAAGLQLTALAARSDKAHPTLEPDSSAEELLFADYVWHEVLAAESPAVVEVLLDTSVLKRVNPELARALTERDDAGELLLEAEARGLFITRLGRSGWLEVHDVVRGELLAEASRRSGVRVATMNARAARWFETEGEVGSSIEHWLQAGLPREALRLLARHVAALYDTGRDATIQHFISRIPLNVATADLRVMLEFAWCQLTVDKRRFIETVERATTVMQRMPDPDDTLSARLTMLQSIAATVSGDWVTGGRLAKESMFALGETTWTDPLGRFGWNMVVRDIALSERWDDESGELEEARLELGRDLERRLAFEGSRALGEALAGHPVDALRISAGVRDLANVNSMMILHAELSCAEAIAHRELGDRPRAVTGFAALAESESGPVTHARVLAMLELTQLRLDEGDLAGAEEHLERASAYVHNDFSAIGGRSWLAHTASLVDLSAGRFIAARGWAEQIDDGFWGGVGLARVELAEGRRDVATDILDRVVTRCPRHEVVRDLLRARAAEGHELAVEHARLAVQLASGAGLVQTVASEGADILELLEVNAWMSPQAWLDRVRRAATPQSVVSRSDPSLPGERLTAREVEVLRMLQSRLTLREIASELFISVNTLKFHLRIIYRKLGVRSRGEAAAQVRQVTTADTVERRP